MTCPAPVASRTSETRSAAVTAMRAVASRPSGLTSQTNVSVSLTQNGHDRRAQARGRCDHFCERRWRRADAIGAGVRRLQAHLCSAGWPGDRETRAPARARRSRSPRASGPAPEEGKCSAAIDPLIALTEAALEEIVGDGVNPQILDGSHRAMSDRSMPHREPAERLERPRARRQGTRDIVGRQSPSDSATACSAVSSARASRPNPTYGVGELRQPLQSCSRHTGDASVSSSVGGRLLVAAEGVVNPGDVPAQEVDVPIRSNLASARSSASFSRASAFVVIDPCSRR